MCDYNILSKKTVQALPVPLTHLRPHLGSPAHRKLVQAVTSRRARHGYDLHDGRQLPPGSLGRGHYMSPINFEHALARMNRNPRRCQWCCGWLPRELAKEHQQLHNHREEIRHHFHESCWQARLLAIAVIFGHVRPEHLFPRRAGHSRMITLRRTITWTVRKSITAFEHPGRRNRRRRQG
ncbi:MAG: hypothetical protein H7A46_23555 [Verrucomicrobiales bacterium]|nr:hypothetical protein [Verrucomicrobiales bacterium]